MTLKGESMYKSEEYIAKQTDEIIEIFKNIRRILNCKFEKSAKKYGFTAPQLSVIIHLYQHPSITLQELSEHMMLTKGTVSGIVDRLTKQGVVIREIPDDNRRIVNLSISEDFKRNNDIYNMKKLFVSLISNGIKKMESEEVEKMIYGLNQLSLLLNSEDSE